MRRRHATPLLFRLFLALVFTSLVGAPAFAVTIADCSTGDAPSPCDTFTCSSFCTFSGATLTCDVSTVGTPGAGFSSEAVVVSELNGHQFHAWVNVQTGMYASSKSCCVIDDSTSGDIDKVRLLGTTGVDTLSFQDDSGSVQTDLEPHSTVAVPVLLAIARGGPGADYVYGARYAGTDFGETLEGNAGIDTIAGDAGSDVCRGGSDPDTILGGDGHDKLFGEGAGDTLEGGAGDDTLFGGPGDDELDGEEGNDILRGEDGYDDMEGGPGDDTFCDSEESTTGVCESDSMVGGSGSDTLWYVATATCGGTGSLDSATTAGTDTDECGDTNDWGAMPWTSCDTDITTTPAECQ